MILPMCFMHIHEGFWIVKLDFADWTFQSHVKNASLDELLAEVRRQENKS